MLILFLFLYFLPFGNLRGAQQPPIEEWSIPDFAQTRFHASRLSQSLKLSYALNPFYQSGDFDGDGKLDVALLVKNKSSGKTGIAIIHSGLKPIVLLGAGTFWHNNPKYDFDWMDVSADLSEELRRARRRRRETSYAKRRCNFGHQDGISERFDLLGWIEI